MRGVLAALLLGLGLWRGWIDWQATIGEGYAYRLAPIGAVLREVWPGFVAPEGDGPVGAAVAVALALPLAPVLILLAALVWRFGKRRRR